MLVHISFSVMRVYHVRFVIDTGQSYASFLLHLHHHTSQWQCKCDGTALNHCSITCWGLIQYIYFFMCTHTHIQHTQDYVIFINFVNDNWILFIFFFAYSRQHELFLCAKSKFWLIHTVSHFNHLLGLLITFRMLVLFKWFLNTSWWSFCLL